MKWTPEAEKAVSRVPFFIRRRVRKKVEEEAARSGSYEVRIEHVTACRERFLHNHEDEVRGYSVATCLGRGWMHISRIQEDIRAARHKPSDSAWNCPTVEMIGA